MPSALTLITSPSSSPRPVQYNLLEHNTVTGLALGANTIQLQRSPNFARPPLSTASHSSVHHSTSLPTHQKSTPASPHTSIQPSHHACPLQRSANILPALSGPSTEQTSTTCSEIDVDVDVDVAVNVPLPYPSLGKRDLYFHRLLSFIQGIIE